MRTTSMLWKCAAITFANTLSSGRKTRVNWSEKSNREGMSWSLRPPRGVLRMITSSNAMGVGDGLSGDGGRKPLKSSTTEGGLVCKKVLIAVTHERLRQIRLWVQVYR